MSVILEALKKSERQRPNRRAIPLLPKRRSVSMLRSPRLLLSAFVAATVAIALAISIVLRPASQPLAPDEQQGDVHAADAHAPVGLGQTGMPRDASLADAGFDSAVRPAPALEARSDVGADEPVLPEAPTPQRGEPLSQVSIPTLEHTPLAHSPEQDLASAADAVLSQPVPQAQSPIDVAPDESTRPRDAPAVLAPGQPQVRPLSTQRGSLDAGLDVHADDPLQQTPFPFVTPLEEVQAASAEPPAYDTATVETTPMPPIPRLDEMPMAFRRELPVLSLDVHSYDATDASRRFVLINLTKLREGDHLTPDTLVVDIVGQGVVLDHNGTQFLLPASN